MVLPCAFCLGSVFILVENGSGGAGSATRRPEFPDSNQAIKIPDSASGFELNLVRNIGPHQFQIGFRSAPVIIIAVRVLDESISGRGLDPIGAGTLADLAKLALEVVAAETCATLREVI